MMGFLSDLYDATKGQLGAACAMLLLFVLPVLIPVAIVVDLDTSDVSGSMWRGLKVVGIFLLAAAVGCLASLALMALFGRHLGGFGLGAVHVLVVGLTVVLGRSSR